MKALTPRNVWFCLLDKSLQLRTASWTKSCCCRAALGMAFEKKTQTAAVKNCGNPKNSVCVDAIRTSGSQIHGLGPWIYSFLLFIFWAIIQKLVSLEINALYHDIGRPTANNLLLPAASLRVSICACKASLSFRQRKQGITHQDHQDYMVV